MTGIHRPSRSPLPFPKKRPKNNKGAILLPHCFHFLLPEQKLVLPAIISSNIWRLPSSTKQGFEFNFNTEYAIKSSVLGLKNRGIKTVLLI